MAPRGSARARRSCATLVWRCLRQRLLHIAGKDQYSPPEAQKQITDGLKGNPLVTIHVYPEMDHAFAREGGQHYDKACADLANTRTDTFFRQHLG